MSIKMMFSAMNIKTGNPTTKLVLLKLADNANDKGECWPSHENIAAICEMSVKTSQRHIKKLEELGLLRITKRPKSNGGFSNKYHLKLDQSIASDCPEHGDKSYQSMASNCPPNQSVESVIESVNQNVGSATQPKPDLQQVRNKAFEHFWKTWRLSKQHIGTTNDAPKAHSKEKFNKLFPVNLLEKKGIDWFRDEINDMCEFCQEVHIQIQVAKDNCEKSPFDRFTRMMPEKFFTQKQWRDQEVEA